MCSPDPAPLAGASRHAAAVRRVPDPCVDPGGYVQRVERLVEDDGVELLLPMTDVSVPLLLPLRNTCPGLVIPFPDEDAYERLTDKARLTEAAGQMGIPVPPQLVLRSASAARRPDSDEGRALSTFARDHGWPLVLKPARPVVVSTSGIRQFEVRMVRSRDELRSALGAYHPEAFPLLVQRRILGPGLGAFLLVDAGRVVATFGHRRIREKPPSGGVSVYRESVALRPDMLEHASRILGLVRWTGVAMVEFKEEAATGTPYLMEVNGRLWGSLQLAIDAGVDFPDLLVRMATGETIHDAPEARLGVRSRWLWGDVKHLMDVIAAPPGYRATHPDLPSRIGALARFAVPWRPGDHYEVLRWSDPRPFLRESLGWLGRLRHQPKGRRAGVAGLEARSPV